MHFFQNLEILSCFMMTGIIWIVQLVHYPTFLFIKNDSFRKFSFFHQLRISIIVIPLMISEIFSHFYLLIYYKDIFSLENIFQTFLILLIWFTTFSLSFPYHKSLEKKYKDSTLKKLIYTNWIRTLSWTFRSLIFFNYL